MDLTPVYEAALRQEGWSIESGVEDVWSRPYLMREKLAGVVWDTGDPSPRALLRGCLAPRVWTRGGEMQVILRPLRVHLENPPVKIKEEDLQKVFEATLDVLAGKLEEVRAARGGGPCTVVFTGGGHLKLPESFRHAMGTLGIGVEILGLDGSTSVVPPPD